MPQSRSFFSNTGTIKAQRTNNYDFAAKKKRQPELSIERELIEDAVAVELGNMSVEEFEAKWPDPGKH